MRDDLDARLRADGAAFRGEAGVPSLPGRHPWLAPVAAAAAVAAVAAGAVLLAGQPTLDTGPAGDGACRGFQYVSSGSVAAGGAGGPDAAVYGWTAQGDALSPTRLSDGAVLGGVSPSPDGARTYTDYPAGGFARVAVLDVDRPAGAPLSTPTYHDSPSWESDERLLTREADADGDESLVVRGAQDASELGRRGLDGQAPTAGIVALPCGDSQPTPASSPTAAAYKPVPWRLEQPMPDDTTLRLQVQEQDCASGEPATGRIRHTLEETADQVIVRVDVTPRVGDSFCPANPVTPYAVPLAEPLGDRTVINGNHGGTSEARTAPADGEDGGAPARSLADRYDDPPAYPGKPWIKDGRKVPHDELVLAAGPEHCGWQESTSLRGNVLSAPGDERGRQWVRDPKGVLDFDPRAQAEFRARAVLPADAVWTGYAQDGVELWVAPSDEAEYVYLVNRADRDDVERWVRGGSACA